MKKGKPVPFRIIGTHKGKLIIMRTYSASVSITIGGEVKRFPSYDAAMQYLRYITRQRKPNGVISHE